MTVTDDGFDHLSRRILGKTADHEVVLRFCEAAKAGKRQKEALPVLETCAARHAEDRRIAGLYIAMCLEQGENQAAMNAIWKMMAQGKPEDALLDAALSVRSRLDAVAAPRPAAAPDLSICMIVRNESAYLSRCLYTIHALADEVVVVDTGSTDRSRDISRIFGVRRLTFPWCDDFSAARNLSLQHAMGRWILVLDADELIAPRDFPALRALVRADSPMDIGYSITTRNYSNIANIIGLRANQGRYGGYEAGLGWFASTKVRLFPRSPVIRFHFPVHERVEPSLRAHGMAIRRCDTPVHHYGHLNETRNREKARHYYQLGYAKLDQMAGDPQALRELAVASGQLERWDESVDLWRRLVKLCPDYIEAYVNLSGAYWQLGNYETAYDYAQKALLRDAGHREAGFNASVSLLLLGRVEEAERRLEALTTHHKPYLPADFMLTAVKLINHPQSGRRALEGLIASVGKPAAAVAIRDLAARFDRHGHRAHARALTANARPLL